MTPWAAAELDPERVAAEMARRFPGCCVWRGEFTGSWWALAGDRLVEAPDPAALGRLLDELSGRDHLGRYSRVALQYAIQAGVGGRVIDTQPGEARNALDAIEATSRETLSGLRRMLTALRKGDPGTAAWSALGTALSGCASASPSSAASSPPARVP